MMLLRLYKRNMRLLKRRWKKNDLDAIYVIQTQIDQRKRQEVSSHTIQHRQIKQKWGFSAQQSASIGVMDIIFPNLKRSLPMKGVKVECPQITTKVKQNAKEEYGLKKGHWEKQETSKYYIFLYHHLEKFLVDDVRRSLRMFKQMSLFIETRNPGQCRTRHQKLCEKYGGLQQNLQKYMDKNNNFGEEYSLYQRKLIDLQEMVFYGILTKEDKTKKIQQKSNASITKIEQNIFKKQIPVKIEQHKSQPQKITENFDTLGYPCISNPKISLLQIKHMQYSFFFQTQLMQFFQY